MVKAYVQKNNKLIKKQYSGKDVTCYMDDVRMKFILKVKSEEMKLNGLRDIITARCGSTIWNSVYDSVQCIRVAEMMSQFYESKEGNEMLKCTYQLINNPLASSLSLSHVASTSRGGEFFWKHIDGRFGPAIHWIYSRGHGEEIQRLAAGMWT